MENFKPILESMNEMNRTIGELSAECKQFPLHMERVAELTARRVVDMHMLNCPAVRGHDDNMKRDAEMFTTMKHATAKRIERGYSAAVDDSVKVLIPSGVLKAVIVSAIIAVLTALGITSAIGLSKENKNQIAENESTKDTEKTKRAVSLEVFEP